MKERSWVHTCIRGVRNSLGFFSARWNVSGFSHSLLGGLLSGNVCSQEGGDVALVTSVKRCVRFLYQLESMRSNTHSLCFPIFHSSPWEQQHRCKLHVCCVHCPHKPHASHDHMECVQCEWRWTTFLKQSGMETQYIQNVERFKLSAYHSVFLITRDYMVER